MSTKTKPIPIAIPLPLLDKIKRAAELLGLSQQDTMRLAMRIGLADLEINGFDQGMIEAEQASWRRKGGMTPLLRVAEDEVPFRVNLPPKGASK